MEQLEGQARLVGGSLLDDRLCEYLVAVNEDGFAPVEGDADYVAAFFGSIRRFWGRVPCSTGYEMLVEKFRNSDVSGRAETHFKKVSNDR